MTVPPEMARRAVRRWRKADVSDEHPDRGGALRVRLWRGDKIRGVQIYIATRAPWRELDRRERAAALLSGRRMIMKALATGDIHSARGLPYGVTTCDSE